MTCERQSSMAAWESCLIILISSPAERYSTAATIEGLGLGATNLWQLLNFKWIPKKNKKTKTATFFRKTHIVCEHNYCRCLTAHLSNVIMWNHTTRVTLVGHTPETGWNTKTFLKGSSCYWYPLKITKPKLLLACWGTLMHPLWEPTAGRTTPCCNWQLWSV